ncbi:MAG: hypothetical protein IKB04_03785 [Clostridia bacterium]|nr:hypothetical protein [Clostridia bacterium]
MCNIAGYIGSREAAPILAEMMKRQEGFGGGYYTGIATVSNGRLYTDKVVGDMQNFLSETNGIHFPGNIGFIHSRSKSGGGVEWGHPFVTAKKDLAYIANGCAGAFLTPENAKKRCEYACMLAEKGYHFGSKVQGAIGDYPLLPDGNAIHSSDLMCQYIAYLIDSGMAPDAAMSKANSDMPSEVVGLILCEQSPDSIFVTRVNYPMMIGITDDGDTYLATTALAFPEDVKFRTVEPLPPCTTCEVFKGGYRTSLHPAEIEGVMPLTPLLWHRVYERAETVMSNWTEQPPCVQDVIDACEDIWGKGNVVQSPSLIYEVLRSFRDEGRLTIVPTPAEGAFEGYTTSNFRVCLKTKPE